MAPQVDVRPQTLTPALGPSIFEHRAVSQETCDPEGQGTTDAHHKATPSISFPDPLSPALSKQRPSLSLNRLPETTPPDASQRASNNEIGNAETRSSQETSSAVEIRPVRGPTETVWDFSFPVPGSRKGKCIYPKASVEFDPWTREQYRARFLFVKDEMEALVDRYLDLRELENRPVYTLRMVGTTPSTAFPSIVITCRDIDARALQDLFRSRAEDSLYIGGESTLSRVRGLFSGRGGEEEPVPRLHLVYYRTRSVTVNRRGSEEPLTAYIGDDGVYCGSLIQYQEATATLGPSIIIDGMNATLTVGHLFSFKRFANSSIVSPTDGSKTSPLNGGGTESVHGLWEDDDEYNDLDEDDSLYPGHVEGNLPHEGKLPGSPGLGKEDLTGRDPELWERVIPPVGLSPSSPYLDWTLARPISYPPLSTYPPNLISPDGPDGRQILIYQIRHQPPRHLASVYIVSGVRGVLHGQILSGSSFLPSLRGQGSCEAWTVILDEPDGLIGGECGSIAIDRETSEVYGHVVGSDPLGHAYVVPLAHVMDQVKVSFEATHVNLTLPLKASDLYHDSSTRIPEGPFAKLAEDPLHLSPPATASLRGRPLAIQQPSVENKMHQISPQWFRMTGDDRPFARRDSYASSFSNNKWSEPIWSESYQQWYRQRIRNAVAAQDDTTPRSQPHVDHITQGIQGMDIAQAGYGLNLFLPSIHTQDGVVGRDLPIGEGKGKARADQQHINSGIALLQGDTQPPTPDPGLSAGGYGEDGGFDNVTINMMGSAAHRIPYPEQFGGLYDTVQGNAPMDKGFDQVIVKSHRQSIDQARLGEASLYNIEPTAYDQPTIYPNMYSYEDDEENWGAITAGGNSSSVSCIGSQSNEIGKSTEVRDPRPTKAIAFACKACTKNGVRASKHGIVYELSRHKRPPRPLKKEPELGFEPVAIEIYADNEKFQLESRVNYSKLVTIEHNVNVFFIGKVAQQHLDYVQNAVNECWSKKQTERSTRKHRR
ncbi:hypothetical protein DL765_004452 [Monosporascus sp. GIB2]|nr:hypothetical protein DL765_004452 [Monosporascus sp. GIB2]